MESMIYRFIVIALFFLTSSLSAQKPPAKFGKISEDNLKLEVYPADSSAPAFYIFDFGNAYFNYNTLEVVLEYHARIKILNERGLKYGDINITREAGTPVQRFKAATYNYENGKMVTSKVNKSMMIDEKTSSSVRRLKVSFPDVHVGSIIEYSYIIQIGNYVHLLPWDFQMDIPVSRSEFNIRIPEYFKYKYITAGYEVMDEIATEKTVDQGSVPAIQYHWAMNNVPALKPEPYMPEINNYYSRIEFELQTLNLPDQPIRNFLISWPAYERELMDDENFVSKGKNLRYLKDSVELLISGITETREKIRVLHDFLTRNVTWNGRESKFTDYTPVKLFKEGKASSAAINFAYMGFLKAAGLDPKPVILSSRDNGLIRDYSRPVSSSYNYVIAYVKDGKNEYLLDATDKFLPFNQLPVHCINGKGRIIDGANSKWIDLTSTSYYSESIMMNLGIDESSGTLDGKARFQYNGLKAGSDRENLDNQGEEGFIKDLHEMHGEWNISAITLENQDQLIQPFTIDETLEVENYIQDMGDLLMFNPVVSGRWKVNPFKGEKRIFPVDFVAPRTEKYLFLFNIPEGYEVDEIPKSARFILQDNSMQFTYGSQMVGDSVLQVTCLLKIMRAGYNQLEYNDIKKFFELVVTKQAENVIIKKKS